MSCCQSCTFCLKCERAVTKERRKSLIKSETRNKFCERCFFCRSLCFCPHCSKCPQCCQCSADRGTSPKILAEVVPPGCKSESSVHLEGRLHSPVQKQTSSGKRSLDSQWLCKPPQEPLPEGGFACLTTKGGNRDGEGSNISSLLQQTFHSSQTKLKWRPILDLSALNKFLSVKTFKLETPETIRISLQQGEWVTSLDFSDAYFHIPVHIKSRKYFRFHFQNQSYQFRALPFGLATAPMEFTCVVKEVKLMAQSQGIRIHQYLDEVDSSPYQRILPPGHPIPPCPLSGIGLGGEPTKIGVGTQTGIRICGLPIRPLTRTGQSDPEPLGIDSPEGAVHPSRPNLSSQELHVTNRPAYSNRKTGAPGETPHETHPVAPQKTLEGPRISRERDSSSKALHPHLLWWTKETNVLLGQPLHPLCHAIQIFTDASKEGWGAHLGDFTASGTWSVPESHLHVNFLELKAALLALKRFQHLVQGKVVLVATDNTTVVAYINKEGGMRSGSLCALLWRLLCWCNLRQVVLKARHIPGRLNVIADKFSRQGQIIQTEWSLHQEVFDLLVQTWHLPQVDMFATKYNCKLAQYVSPVPDPNVWAVDVLTVSWENLDMYAFPPVSLLGKVVSKLSDHLYKRVILIAPGWPKMPLFWDLVELSSQIPLCLPIHPDLVTQLFNKARHRNLTNLNLHAWLLEPRQSRSRVSLAQWRHELRSSKKFNQKSL